MDRADNLLSVADVVATSVEGGEIRVNLGDSVTNMGLASDMPFYGLDGFISRPNDPNADGAAQAVYMQDGNQRRVIASRDNRWVSATGNPAPGDRFIVSNCSARFMLKQSNSSMTLYAENEKDDGSSMILSMNGKEGTFAIAVGGCAITLDKDSITFNAHGSTLTLNADALTMMGKFFMAATAGGCLGVIPPGIAPPPGATSLLAGPSGMVAVPSSKWTMAPG